MNNTPAKGFSIVEIMVGMAVGLLATIVIFQVFAASEGYKRTTSSGGDAQQNGAIALYSLEREARKAGYGINDVSVELGCSVRTWDLARLPPASFNFNLSPFIITEGVGGAPDTLTITYGGSDMRNVPANFIANSTAASEQYRVDNRFGFAPGDLILATEPGLDCTLSQVSTLPPGGDEILYNTGSYTDPVTGNSQQIRYNRPGGLGVSYTANAKLYNLGRLPARTIYSISNSRLMEQTAFTGAAAIPIVDGIVQLQAEYGRDTTVPIMDWTVDVWDTTTPANSDDWKRVVAVRLAVVARSGLREKLNSDTNACETTATLPKWKNGTDITLNNDADGTSWKCYRYRAYETVVPLRNAIWRTS